jgi:hypothetical protein
VVPIQADHQNVVRFRDGNDDNFRAVSGNIRTLTKRATEGLRCLRSWNTRPTELLCCDLHIEPFSWRPSFTSGRSSILPGLTDNKKDKKVRSPTMNHVLDTDLISQSLEFVTNALLPPTTIIADALDECGEESEPRKVKSFTKLIDVAIPQLPQLATA